jgi:hypothetical protein
MGIQLVDGRGLTFHEGGLCEHFAEHGRFSRAGRTHKNVNCSSDIALH